MLCRKIAIVLCTMCLSSPALSSGDEDLWFLPTAVSCIAQYPELANTRLGTILVNAPQVQKHIQRAKAVFAIDPWDGRALCDELMHDKPDPNRDDRAYFNKMRDRHLDALKALVKRFPEGWSFSSPPR
jgi:hypothetical protein